MTENITLWVKGLLEVEFAFRAFLAETPGAFTVNMTNKKQQLEFSQTKATARQSHNAMCCLFPQRFANKQPICENRRRSCFGWRCLFSARPPGIAS